MKILFKKYFLVCSLIAALLLQVPSLAFAAGDEAIFEGDTYFFIADLGINLTVASGSKATNIIVNNNSLEFTLGQNSNIIVRSYDMRGLIVNGNLSSGCATGYTQVQLTIGVGSNVTIVPTTTQNCSTQTSSNSGGGGGGGGSSEDSLTPTNLRLNIISGSNTQSTGEVLLSLSANGATQMMISNQPDLKDAVFEPYGQIKNWKMFPGSGLKTVYARFRSSGGTASGIISNSIRIDKTQTQLVTTQTAQTLLKTPNTQTTSLRLPLYRDLSVGILGDDVAWLQTFLEKKGLLIIPVGTPKGKYGGLTRDSVSVYQKTHGLAITGKINAKTRTEILADTQDVPLSPPPSSGGVKAPLSAENQLTTVTNQIFTRELKIGDIGTDVTKLQTFLEEKGLLQIPLGIAKGKYGAITWQAVAKYQKSVGITPSTGLIGPKTRQHLNKILR